MKKLAVIGFLAAALSVEAMTFEELQQTVTAAEAGSTVYVTSDLTYAGTLAVGKKLTLASAPGSAFVITRSSSCTSPFLSTSSSDDVTLTNLIVDGNKGSSSVNAQFVKVAGGKLTLASGAVLRNYYSQSESIKLTGGTLIMEDGAVLSGFECKSWGAAVSINSGATFQMNGGLVTDCVGHQTSSKDSDGMVYVNGGTFRFYGGLITGNRSAVANAGIVCYSGTTYLHGDACCTNNVGGYSNDLAFWSGGRLYLDGAYTGKMTVLSKRDTAPQTGYNFDSIKSTEANRLGACNIRCQEFPDFILNLENRLADETAQWANHTFVIDALRSRAELKDAVNLVAAGGKIEVQRDWVQQLWETITVSNGVSFTLCSRPGHRYELSSYPGTSYKPSIYVKDGSAMRIENVAITGIPAETRTFNFFMIYANSSLTLGPGTIIEGASGDVGAVWVREAGSILTMEDGAVIRNMRSGWGAAVRVGLDNTVASPAPVFRMLGGAITNNAIIGATRTYANGWGGAVCCTTGSARFEMSGGVIAENVSDEGQCTAGVFANGANAKVVFSGAAQVWGNTGNYADALFYKGATAEVIGDFRGKVGVSSPGVAVGTATGITLAEGASGAWCFVSKWSGAVDAYVGKADASGAVTFGAPIGSVGGVAVAAESDLDHVIPATLDLNVCSADRARLPIVFGGKALEHAARITVTFDSAAMKTSGDLPLTVLAAASGQSFVSGNLRFTTPEDPDGGYWRVKPAAAGTEYSLRWLESVGCVLLFR